MKRKPPIAIALSVAAASLPAAAQHDRPPVKQEVQQPSILPSSGSDSTDSALAEVEKLSLDIYGFADFTYTQLLNDFALASPYPTFMVGHLNLYLETDLGEGWHSLTEFRLLYLPHGAVSPSEAFSASPTRTDTTAGDPADLGRPLRWGGVEIERAWLEYRAYSWLALRVGQWLTPYGIWNVDHGSPVIIGVRRPYVVGEALIPERQTGVLAHGSYLVGTTELGYALGLSNGRGPLDAYQDLDENKAVTARLFAIHDSELGNVALGFAIYRGRFTDRQSRIAFTPEGLGTEWLTSARFEELSMAADVKWRWQSLTLQTELMLRETAFDDRFRPPAPLMAGAPPGFMADFRSLGFYALAAYQLPWLDLTPFFGGENYDPGHPFIPSAAALWGGLNLHPTPRVVLKGQYTHSWFTDGTSVVGDDGMRALDLQAAWSF